jgi:CMP-N-acetylneuraminic acid synthetase
VSTDDEEIARVAKQNGADIPFMRPAELAKDTSSTIDVIMHAINYFKCNDTVFDYLAVLEPTSPLRKYDDIDNAIYQLVMQEQRADSLVSIGKVHLEHPSVMKIVNDNYLESYLANDKGVNRRQDLDTVFFPYGVIYLSKIDKLIEHKTFYQQRTIPYFIERWQNYEIDDKFDFLIIEKIIEIKKEVVSG